MCQRTDGRTDKERRVIRSIKLFRAVSFFLRGGPSHGVQPNALSVNWCYMTWINFSDALNHNCEQNYYPKLSIYTSRDLQMVLYVLLFKKIQPFYHTMRFIIVLTKSTYQAMSSTRQIQSPPSDPTMLESHLPLCRSSSFLHFLYKYCLFTQCIPVDLVDFLLLFGNNV